MPEPTEAMVATEEMVDVVYRICRDKWGLMFCYPRDRAAVRDFLNEALKLLPPALAVSPGCRGAELAEAAQELYEASRLAGCAFQPEAQERFVKARAVLNEALAAVRASGEPTERLTNNEREAVLSMMRYAWAHGVPESLDYALVEGARRKIERASVLEERDRTIQELRDDYDSLSGRYKTCHEGELKFATEAIRLRFQLTEARAALQTIAESRVPGHQWGDIAEFAQKALDGLVPAPQDGEPA